MTATASAQLRFLLIVSVHRLGHTIRQKYFHCLGRTQNPVCDRALFLAVEMSQHMIRQIHLCRLISHAHFDSGEILRPQSGNDALDSIVTACGTLLSQAKLSHRQTDVIKNYQHFLRGNLIVSGDLRDRISALKVRLLNK